MTSLSANQSPLLPRKAPAAAKQHRITGKVRAAVDLMVWQGLKRDEAAKRAGLQDNSLYVALRKPDVRRYYLEQIEVLRTSERARNIHALVDVRDGENQAARVAAVKVLEQLGDEAEGRSSSVQRSPGVVVIVNSTPADIPHIRQIEANPLESNDDV